MHITLQAAPQTALAKPLLLDVTISNPGSHALEIDDPAQSLAIEFHLVDQRTREDLSFTAGKLTATTFGSADQYALEVPTKRLITIAPKGSLSYRVDANAKLYLRPGDFDAFVSHKESQSNHVPVKVVLTRDSVALLFATARDAQMDYSRREWATDRLARLYPGFKLSLALPTESATARSQQETTNAPVYTRFAEWWRDQLTAPDLDQRLDKLR